MDLTDFSNGKLWAITESHLQNMLDRLPEVFKESIKEAANFKAKPQERDDFMLRNGVAIIPVNGPIVKRGSFYSYIFNATPLDQLTEIFMDAIEQKDVEAIAFDFDSPGGTISGLEAFGNIVFEKRGIKPMVSVATGMMTSAAYWFGSAADKVVTEKTSDIGNIGIYMIHYDWSDNDKQFGLKRTIIKSGRHKALGNDAEPLSDFAQKTFQAEIDYVQGLFLETVKRNRKISEFVDKEIIEGKNYIGQQAVDVGLADKIGNLDTAIELAQSMVKAKNTFYFKTSAMSKKNAIDIVIPKREKQLTINIRR